MKQQAFELIPLLLDIDPHAFRPNGPPPAADPTLGYSVAIPEMLPSPLWRSTHRMYYKTDWGSGTSLPILRWWKGSRDFTGIDQLGIPPRFTTCPRHAPPRFYAGRALSFPGSLGGAFTARLPV